MSPGQMAIAKFPPEQAGNHGIGDLSMLDEIIIDQVSIKALQGGWKHPEHLACPYPDLKRMDPPVFRDPRARQRGEKP